MIPRTLRRTLTYAALLAGLVAIYLFIPLAKDAYAAYQKEQEDLRYSTGLYPCDFYWDDFSKYIDTHLPGLPDVSVDVFPASSDAEALRVVGQDIFYFRAKDRNITQTTSERADTKRSALSKATSEDLLSVLTNEVVNARAERPMGLDGATYVFRTGRTNKCAATWSPDTETRAGDIVDIYYSAINYTANSAEDPVNESQLKAKIEALRDR